MKQLLFTLGLMAMTCLGLQAENRIVTDTVDGKKRVIELQDTVVDGQNVTDTLSITTYEGKREPTVTNYKNRKAKYRLAEQALANGQQLPPEFFEGMERQDLRSRGIKNIFLGIGLFIFLWAITESFGLGCIGLLVMFTGFGQVVTYFSRPENRPDIHIERDETTGRRKVNVGGIEITNHKNTSSSEDEAKQNDPQQ